MAPDARLVTWTVSGVGAFAGTLSHVALDAIMHRDMAPLWPLSDANALLRIVSVDTLHDLCLIAGVVGILGVVTRRLMAKR